MKMADRIVAGRGADQRDIRLPGQSCLAYDRLARFMRFRRAIKGTCQAYCRPELSLVNQLAEVSEVLPTRPDHYSLCAFRVPENSGNRLYATPEKEARRRQRRHIGSAGHEERPATDEGTLAHGVKDHIKAIQAGHEVLAAIVNDMVGPERLDKCNVCGSTGGACLCSKRLGDLSGEVTDTTCSSKDERSSG